MIFLIYLPDLKGGYSLSFISKKNIPLINSSNHIYKIFTFIFSITNIIYFFIRAKHLELANVLSQNSEISTVMSEKIQSLSLQTQITENIILIIFVSFVVYFILKNGFKDSMSFLIFTFFFLVIFKIVITIFTSLFGIYTPDYTWQLQRPIEVNLVLLIAIAFLNSINKVKSRHIQSMK